MNQATKLETTRIFRELIDIDEIDNIKVTYRTEGGPPGKLLSEQIIFFGNGNVNFIKKDETESANLQERFLKLDRAIVRSLFNQISRGLDNYIRIEIAPFLPDSVISSITIELENKQISVYFLTYEMDRIIQNSNIPQEMAEAIKSIENISKEFVNRNNG
jgi:hypothetical protein